MSTPSRRIAALFVLLGAAILLALGADTLAIAWPGSGWSPGPQPIATPIIPTSWTTAAWYIDPANASGCASDLNAGTSSSCAVAGAGPLLTFQELNVHRWGCAGNPSACPRIRQNTTITFLSSHTTNADPVYLAPGIENGAKFMLQGTLGAAQQVCSTTLSAVTAKNQATPQLLNATFAGADAGCAGLAADQLVANSTHSSRAYIYAPVDAGVWSISQPLAPVTPPQSPFSVTEVNTWASSDSVTVYSPVQINLVYFVPVYVDANASPSVYQATLWDPNGVAADQAVVGGINIWESQLQRTLVYVNSQGPFDVIENSASLGFVQSFLQAGSFDIPFGFYGGIIGTSGSGSNAQMAAAYVDFDAIFAVSSQIMNLQYGPFYIETSQILEAAEAFQYSTFNTPVIWGPGKVDVISSGHFQYTAGASKAAATFKNTGGLQINGGTVGCIAKPSAASIGACNTTVSATNLDTNLGATSGCIGALGGGAFCNFGP